MPPAGIELFGYADDEDAPPVGGGGGRQSQHQSGHSFSPPGIALSQVVLHDEAQALPAQDDYQCPGGDAPDHRPGFPHNGAQVGPLRVQVGLLGEGRVLP